MNETKHIQLKKIYLEITNGCNLNCDFCIKNQRKVTSITIDNYKLIIDKINDYTKELYLHVLGEPLMHPDINYFIDYAYNSGLLVNITTNGYLIDRVKGNHHIHRINVSLHSFNNRYKVDLMNYLDNIFNVIDNLRDKTFISLRLWVNGDNTDRIIDYINKRYNVNINKIEENKKIKITNNLIIDTFHEFIWPDLENDYYSEVGTCRGLIDHIGILSDGRIVPCCLDSKGIITLGNIYENNIDEIYEQRQVKEMIDGFKKNCKCHELCKYCKFLN